MYQDFHDIDAIEVQDTEQYTVHYTVDDLTALLKVKRRQVFNLVKTVKQAYFWEPETVFNPSLGKYSERCLVELRRVQTCKTSSEYIALVASENQKPQQANKTSTSALVPTRHTEALENKLANIQKNTTALNVSVQDRIAAIKERIATEANRTKSNQTVLDDLEAQQAITRGIEKGLKIFELEQQAAAATVEQLTLEKLQQQ
ncbi:hypothetical protein [Nostoc sp. CHAB 5715]|uniref:hypothetical protein n=1 Tax=Nostoc sp. CHAB 5715 TaxID=2780400 RepID=UPI001E30D82D|nr:hypothetical protein [Nostoc sp. CHAB 5715]MCC5620807.1 hypothetical protein [Nostoc sp. CHAB 5715]